MDMEEEEEEDEQRQHRDTETPSSATSPLRRPSIPPRPTPRASLPRPAAPPCDHPRNRNNNNRTPTIPPPVPKATTHPTAPNPSPSPRPTLHLAQRDDIFPPQAHFDAAATRIRRLAERAARRRRRRPFGRGQPGRPGRAARLRELVDILGAATGAASIGRVGAVLGWPVLRAGWAAFVRDALAAPAVGAAGPGAVTVVTVGGGDGDDGALLPVKVAVTVSGAGGEEEKKKKKTKKKDIKWRVEGWSRANEDLGLPCERIVASRLLEGIQQSRDVDVARISPVRTEVLHEWGAEGKGPWQVTGRPQRRCTVEDYYGRFVLRCVAGLYSPTQEGRHGEERAWRDRLAWLRDPAEVGGVKDQMWIFYHVLLYLHCEMRERIKAGEVLVEWYPEG